MWAINKAVGIVTVSADGLGNAFKGAGIWIKGAFGGDIKQDMIDYRAEVLETEKAFDELIGVIQKPKVPKKETITGIKGTAKPKTQLEIENEIKKQSELKKVRDKANADKLKEDITIKREWDAANAEMLKGYDDFLAEKQSLLEDFDDAYLQSIVDGQTYELIKLTELYDERAKHVTDKAKLDEWYNNEVSKLLSDNEEQYKAFGEMQEAVVNGMTNAMVEFAMTGKTSFSDMANAIIADLIRIQVQKTMVGIFGGGDSSGIIGGLLALHTRGTVGSVPSYHSGMRSDERMAKLQVGESVVNRAGTANNAEAIDAMNKGQAVGGGGGNVTTAEIKFEVTAIDAASFDSYLVNNRRTIESIINNSLTQNGSVRQTIKAVV